MSYTIHTDGGARGNPGPAAIGILIIRNKEEQEIGRVIGEATNNVAEYTAVLEAWREILKRGVDEGEKVEFFLDSTLVVNQLNGLFKLKDAKLRKLFFEVQALTAQSGGVVRYTYIPRELNTRADGLVNAALDTDMSARP
jgi:ribonuclease HI